MSGVLARGDTALAEGRWVDAKAAFEASLLEAVTAEAHFGLAAALWWLGESHACVEHGARAYALFREGHDDAAAARCAMWLAITYKSNFANLAAANGWVARARRLLEALDDGVLRGWLAVARAYRMPDLEAAERLTVDALDRARQVGDVDLQLVAMAQLGHIRVGQGDVNGGFELLDEAVAAALAGERSVLDTVVYTCCDMLSACELADDLERADQWCKVADAFVATYGCPFLYAECRIYFGSVLVAKGRWGDGERELAVGRQLTDGACPALHARAVTRLAGLRVRQGRLEEAARLLAELGDAAEAELETAPVEAALRLARRDAPGAVRSLERRMPQLAGHPSLLVVALDLLVDAQLAAGEVERAGVTAVRLRDVAAAGGTARWLARAAAAAGRIALARGDEDGGAELLESACETWASLDVPFETARTRADLACLHAGADPAVAVDHARRALATFERLGAAPYADRVAALLRSLGINARTGPKGVGALSAREREVLRLVAAGLSNPEIAHRLHISRKTAAHHVSSILTKLDLRNRAEAAARAAEQLAANGDHE